MEVSRIETPRGSVWFVTQPMLVASRLPRSGSLRAPLWPRSQQMATTGRSPGSRSRLTKCPSSPGSRVLSRSTASLPRGHRGTRSSSTMLKAQSFARITGEAPSPPEEAPAQKRPAMPMFSEPSAEVQAPCFEEANAATVYPPARNSRPAKPGSPHLGDTDIGNEDHG